MDDMSGNPVRRLGLTAADRGTAAHALERDVAAASHLTVRELERVVAMLEGEAAALDQRAMASVEIDGGRASEIEEDFQVVQAVLGRFRTYLSSARGATE